MIVALIWKSLAWALTILPGVAQRSGGGQDESRCLVQFASLTRAEHALEDGVDVLEVEAEVELFSKLGIRQIFLHVGVLLQEGEHIPFAAPDLHRVALHEAVGVLAARAFLGQRQQHAAGVYETAEAIKI